MDQDKISIELNLLEKQLKVLVKTFNVLNQEVLTLRKENQNLKEILKEREQALNNFQNQIKISKIADYTKSEGDVTELKQMINKYIKEIDKCIAYLER